ncbi:MAG: hypothetical protein M3253_02260 [Chloroflexota bacterium]|nr:hypothetical protein [Chloroflexota bacterium]
MTDAVATGRVASLRSSVLRLAERPWLVALAIGLAAAAIYLLSNPNRPNIFDHFVWQAEAFLNGRFAIRWPVHGDEGNWYLHDVMPLAGQPGFALIPFPPLPAVLLMPLVAVFGVATDQSVLAALLGGLNVALVWLVASQLTRRRGPALLATVFFGFGTVHWYAAMLGSTWYYAHVVAVTFLLLSIILALDGERLERAYGGRRTRAIDGRQFVAGLMLGVAALARLPVIFGAPFLLFVGGGGSYLRRGFWAGLGAAIPLALLLAYNFGSTGELIHPAYEYLYRFEYAPRPELIHRDWMIEDPRYLPQNLAIMLAWPPVIRPECGLALLDPACPPISPDPLAMSILLTSPGYLLVLPALTAWRQRLVLGAGLAVLTIAVFNLMHFSQGWVQFGYRFSNDFAPYALILVTLGIVKLGLRPLTRFLVAASIVINAWGVYWGVALLW